MFTTTGLSSANQTFFVVGQTAYTSLAAAQGESLSNIAWGTIPFQEVAPLSDGGRVFTIFLVFMVSIFMFLSLNMMVTIIGNVEWRLHKNELRVQKINFWGFVVTLVVPIVLFASIALFAM